MMSITDTNIQKLIINRLTQEKYDELLSSNQINDNELYITDTNDDSYSKPETDELLAQKADIQAVYTKDETDGFFTEIEDKINTITIPTNISELNNDIGYITQDELSDQYVDTTTDQDISGLKTFLAEELVIRNNNMSFDTTPVSRLESRIVFKGSDGKPINNITCNRYPDGSTYVEFHIHAQNNAWSQPNTCLRFGHNGTRFLAEVPNPTSDSNSREIATTSWVMQKLGDIGNILDTINGEII